MVYSFLIGTKRERGYTIKHSNLLLYFSLFLYVILFLAYSPVSDLFRWRYESFFQEIYYIEEYKDTGWILYNKFIRAITNSSIFFFIISAAIYMGGYYCFAHKYINKTYGLIFILVTTGSFGFVTYGVSTIRAGIALSIFLMALVCKDKRFLFLILCFLAIIIHKSLLIPIVFFLFSKYIKNINTATIIWLLMLVLSILNIPFVGSVMSEYLSVVDTRSTYFNTVESENYNVGFRWDFLFYSVLPIFYGRYFIVAKKLHDIFYQRLYITYILTNAVWLLVIRIAYTDRIAYLSWFLIPFLLLYPLFVLNLKRKEMKIGIVSFFIVFISYLISILT